MKQSFTDFEEFVAATPEVDARWLIAGEGKPRWYNATTQAGNCILQSGFSETPLSIEGAGSTEGFGIYVPFGNSWKNNGEQFDANSILIIEPGAEFCVPSSGADGWNLMFVPKTVVSEICREPSKYSYTVKNQNLRCDIFRQKIRNILEFDNYKSSEDSSFAKLIIELELNLIMRPVLNYYRKEFNGTSNVNHSENEFELIVKSRAMLEQKLNEDEIIIPEIAKSLEISERTFRNKFKKFYNMPPYKYIKSVQMLGVRRDLVNSSPCDVNVTDILIRWGVWEFGRFAGRYKKYFGETPIDTLSR